MGGKSIVAFSGLLLLAYLTTVDAQVFSVASTTTYRGDGKLEPVPFDKIISNPFFTFDEDNNQFVCESPGVYYFTFSAGMEANMGAHLTLEKDFIQGAEVLNTDTENPGVGFVSRGILQHVQQGVGMHLSARLDDSKSLQGDTYAFQTSWAGFRYQDLTSVPIAFSVANTANLIGSAIPVRYDTELLNIGWLANNPYNMSSGVFRSQAFGIYFFHISAGSLEEREIRLNVTKNFPSDEMASLYRTARMQNGVDTISRSFMIELDLGDEVQVVNDLGSELFSNAGLQTSFSGFLYYLQLNPDPTNICFYAYRSTSWESVQPFAPYIFDVEVLQRGLSYNVTTGIFTCGVGGSYFFSVSAGAMPFKRVGMSLRHNGQPQLRLENRSDNHNGIDTFSRDVILNMAEGDVAHVEADGDTATYSDVGAQTSFMGFRLRNVEPGF